MAEERVREEDGERLLDAYAEIKGGMIGKGGRERFCEAAKWVWGRGRE